MAHKPFDCSRCGKRFKSRRATDDHIRDVHKGNGEFLKVSRHRKDQDESFADRAIQAQIDKASGVYNVDQEWLL